MAVVQTSAESLLPAVREEFKVTLDEYKIMSSA